mmetsp:Transcript_40151/g.119663  ORF Transcript_40151/g.119663 Transcript_40151/m.119663 type:complete len:256 (-) Transcript_40151:265-1032(-)
MTTCDSSSGMATFHALNVLPRYLISSGGIFGCGWLRLMPSNMLCTTFGRTRACLWWYSFDSRLMMGFASAICCGFSSVAHTIGKTSTHRWCATPGSTAEYSRSDIMRSLTLSSPAVARNSAWRVSMSSTCGGTGKRSRAGASSGAAAAAAPPSAAAAPPAPLPPAAPSTSICVPASSLGCPAPAGATAAAPVRCTSSSALTAPAALPAAVAVTPVAAASLGSAFGAAPSSGLTQAPSDGRIAAACAWWPFGLNTF